MKELKIKITLINIVLSLLLTFYLSGCAITDNAQGLKEYFLGFIAPHDIKIKEIACEMEQGTRAGYFLFEITPEEFSKLKKAISLKKYDNIFDKTDYGQYLKYEIKNIITRCSLVEGFKFISTQYEKNENGSWAESPFLPRVSSILCNWSF